MSKTKMTVQSPQLSKKAFQLLEKAVRDFNLIEPGDHVAVGVSGGKDSIALACGLRQLQANPKLNFTISLLHLDQHQPGFDRHQFEQTLAKAGFECEVVSEDTHSVVQAQLKPGEIPCSLCSRMRRGILNEYAQKKGYQKLALGHHLDDAIETFFMNLFFGNRLDRLKPVTPSDNTSVTTIRPLILLEERKIIDWVQSTELIPVACPICDHIPESQRKQLKQMVGTLQQQHPGDWYGNLRRSLYEKNYTSPNHLEIIQSLPGIIS